MRIRHSFKAFAPFILMLAAGRSAQAQYGAPVPPQQVPPGSYPPAFQPYPMASPYQGLFEQNYNSDGMWFRDPRSGFGPSNAPREWNFGVEYTRTRTNKMEGIVGAEGVQTYFQQMDPANDGIVDGLEFYNYFDAARTSLIPQMINHGMRLTGGFQNVDGSGLMMNVNWSGLNTETYDARGRAERARMDTLTALSLASTNGTAQGRIYNGSGQTDRDIVENSILAPGVTFDQANAVQYGFHGSTFQVLDRSVFNLHGIPILSGNTPIVANGETAPYDLDFILQHTLQTVGTSIDWAFTPVVEGGSLTVRPLFGGRFFRIDEGFRFRGASTLLSYGPADGDAPVNAKVFPPADGVSTTGTGGTTGDRGSIFIPDTPGESGDPDFAAPVGPTHLIVKSFLNSQVTSTMGGPEFGFTYDIGNRRGMRLSGSTRVAAMFNEEKIRLSGDNIGNFMGVEVIPDPITGENIALRMFDTNSTQGPTDNAFSDTRISTHLSPLFEQSFNLEVPIFSEVPVLKDVQLLEKANLNLGWTWLWVGDVADPNRSVLYQSSPVSDIFPEIRTVRNDFIQSTLSVGIAWNY